MKIKFTDDFKDVIEKSEFLVKGFYYCIGTGLGVDGMDEPEDLEHSLLEEFNYQRTKSSVSFTSLVKASSLRMKRQDYDSTYLSIDFSTLGEIRSNYKTIWVFYLDLMRDTPGDYYRLFDPNDPSCITGGYWNADGTVGKEFLNSSRELDEDKWEQYRVKLAFILQPSDFDNLLKSGGNNIIDLQFVPKCSFRYIQSEQVEHISSSRVDKYNVHKASMLNQFINLNSAIDKINEHINAEEKLVGSISIDKSGLITI